MTKRSQRRKLEEYGYASDGTSLKGLAAPVNTTLPTQIGPAKVANLQTCNPGVWTGGYARTSYQWKVNGVSIPGASGAGYTPIASDVSKALTCLVSVVNPAGGNQLATGTASVVP